MSNQVMEYINDEELMKLISDIETNDMVVAPPSIKEEVLSKVDHNKKVIEYKKFRNKVILAVAAILLISIFMPKEFPGITSNNNDQFIVKSEILKDFGNSHYISDLLNGREE